jgi:transglutaminase-like putative cysteine protease
MKSISSKIIILVAVLVFSGNNINKARAEFASGKIPAELLEDANSVYRINNMTIEFDGPGGYTMKREIALTILNENGKGPDALVIHYDGNSKARFNSGEIFDSNGNSITRIRRRDLTDRSNISGFSLYEDNRVILYIPRISSYPYTVHYEYEVSYNRGMYYAMSFSPIPSFDQSTESAELTISWPQEMDMYYREFNLDDKSGISSSARGMKYLTWDFVKLKAQRREFRSPASRFILPYIMFAPEKFEYDGYAGSNESWEEFGKWVWTLNEGRDQLPQERIDYLNDLVKDMDNNREKVKAIYQFMQSRTRYVNIALGIGGMQPFDASTVDRTGYGDCKALTNYMMAMLRAVGIESNYTLVRSGEGSYNLVEDFPTSQFNHVILSVPLENDTIWLECTSQHLPFNHLGDFTDNRPVLVIREDGGHLVRTPAYDREENINNSLTLIQLDRQGHGTGNMRLDYGGIYFVDYFGALRLSEADQQKWLYDNFSFSNYSINNHSIAEQTEPGPIAIIEMDFSLRSFASVSGQRMFVPLNLVSSARSTPPRVRNRQTPFVLSFDKVEMDTLIIKIPEGFELESSLNEFLLESEFGKFSTEFIVRENEIWYVRNLETIKGTFPAEKYQEFFRFYQGITRADSQSLTFIRSNRF